MAENLQFVSFCGDDFVQGGLIDNVDVVIKDIVFTKDLPSEEYRSAVPVFFAKAYLGMLDDPNVVIDQSWSCGALKDHQPVDDEGNEADEGHRLIGSAMMKGSNFHHFVQSMELNGLSKELTRSGDLRSLIGAEMHVERKTIKREGLAGAVREDGRAAGQVLLCTKMLHAPGEKRVTKARPAARTAAAARTSAAAAAPAAPAAAPAPITPPAPPTPPPPPPPPFDAETVAIQVLSDILTPRPDGISMAEAKLEANRELINTHKTNLIQRNKVVGLLFNPDWLAAQGITLDGDQLSVPA